MDIDTGLIKKRAPTLYFIIVAKLIKGVLFLLLALGVYHLHDKNLPDQFRQLLEFFHLDPERKFFVDLAVKLGGITKSNVVWIATGTLLYSVFSLVEGIGLIFRVPWAGWLAIGESAFFIPIEVRELVLHPHWYFLSVLAFNVLIVWYLYANRVRLFRHHHRH